IDIESEDIQRQRNDNILQKGHTSLAPSYRARMAKTGTLNGFGRFLERESIINERIQQILKKYDIYIPADYYDRMIETNFFKSLLKIVHDVNHENELWRITSLTRPNNQKRKIHYNDDDDDDDDNGNNHNDQQIRKQKKTKQNDNATGINSGNPRLITVIKKYNHHHQNEESSSDDTDDIDNNNDNN
ncbi:unnamed protein product, partial [Adineta steineri]